MLFFDSEVKVCWLRGFKAQWQCLLVCLASSSGFDVARHRASVRFSYRSIVSPTLTTLQKVFVFLDRRHNITKLIICIGVTEEVSNVFI